MRLSMLAIALATQLSHVPANAIPWPVKFGSKLEPYSVAVHVRL